MAQNRQTIHSEQFSNLDKREFTTFFNSLSGAKPGYLIGSGEGDDENLAVFNSITHLGTNPPLLGFIQRPTTVDRHTYQNILKYKHYSFNLITETFFEKAHQSSARYAKGINEFKEVGLTAVHKKEMRCPFVAESPLHIALELFDDVEIKSNNTRLIVGKVLSVSKPKILDKSEGALNFQELKGVNISGLSDYYTLKKVKTLNYAKPK
jgi:flavin reductase (DIM6/NTAB) family NADH-FMN oxidoreductase RutF